MASIIECVPNFSEGQRKDVIEAIASAIGATDGCNVLDVDPGASTNRTVYTFVGSPEAVVEGALNAARAAFQLIDMRRHSGEHPRIGAMDVCPFIPVKNADMEDCVECAKEFGERLAAEIGVPVYLYGYAAKEDYRRAVPQIRAGEYEGLLDKLTKEEWKPDFGLPEFVPSWGATLVGARKFLVAYNVNLLATKEQAHRIALNIREQGRGKDQPGRLKHVQAIGWYLEEANMAQVSVNITDYEETPIHRVYEEIEKDAKELNLAICGSQVVGLVPLKAVTAASDYYMERENLFLLEEDQKIRLVVDRLGLHSLGAFSPKERIIEYMVQEEKDGPLVSMDLRDFLMAVGARSPSPGGGSVSALIAALGAALGAMVGFLTYGNKKYSHLDGQIRKLLPPLYEASKDLLPLVDADAMAFTDYMVLKYSHLDGQIRKLLPPLYEASKDLLPLVDADAMAFTDYMAACKLSESTEDDKTFRDSAVSRAIHNAVAVPMNVMLSANALWPTLVELAGICNINAKSDLQVGVKSLETGVWGAYQNVQINIEDMKDEEFKKKAAEDSARELKIAQDKCAEILDILAARKQ